MKLELFFLNIKFSIIIDKETGIKVKKFWTGFLEKNTNIYPKDTWTIYFTKDKVTSTDINYDTKTIIHKHNSVCDITEFNNFFREAVVKISTMQGVVWLHCSGFNLNGKTFLVLGKKGYGKTTILMKTLKELGAVFIGNDQLPIFSYENDICTYSWRPDVKVASQYDNSKIFYLVNNNIPYDFLNADNMSKRLKKTIEFPKENLNINISHEKIFKIDNILILNSVQNIIVTNDEILKYVIDDPEVIIPDKLLDLGKYMPYWNKRITKIKNEENADKISKGLLNALNKQTTKYLVGNRLNFELLKNTLFSNNMNCFSLDAIDYIFDNYQKYLNVNSFVSISVGGSVSRGYGIKSSDIDLICLTNRYKTYKKKFIKENGFNIEIHIIPIKYIDTILESITKYLNFSNLKLNANDNNLVNSSGAKKCKLITKNDTDLTVFLSNWRELKKIVDSVVIYQNKSNYLFNLINLSNKFSLKKSFLNLLTENNKFTNFDNFINYFKLNAFINNDVFSKVLWVDLYMEKDYNQEIKKIIKKYIKVNKKSNEEFYKWYKREFNNIIEIHSSLECDFCKNDYMQCNIIRCINDYYNDATRARDNNLKYGEYFSIQRVLTYISLLYDRTNNQSATLQKLLDNFKIDNEMVNFIVEKVKEIIYEKIKDSNNQ